MITLKERIAVYIPSTINANETSDNAEYVESALRLLSALCGGATSQTAIGAWVAADTGELIVENVTIVYAFCESAAAILDAVLQFAEYIKISLSQQGVSVENNGTLTIV